MVADFTKIAITSPHFNAIDVEARHITRLLITNAVDRVHLRKPVATSQQMEHLINAIPEQLHSRLTLHDQTELILHYPAIGFHINSRHPSIQTNGTLSKSCHSIAEVINDAAKYDYVTLSPVFDSISKTDYHSANFNPVDERIATSCGNVIALGGITPEHFDQLQQRGYAGAAMLGYIWQNDIDTVIQRLCSNS